MVSQSQAMTKSQLVSWLVTVTPYSVKYIRLHYIKAFVIVTRFVTVTP